MTHSETSFHVRNVAHSLRVRAMIEEFPSTRLDDLVGPFKVFRAEVHSMNEDGVCVDTHVLKFFVSPNTEINLEDWTKD